MPSENTANLTGVWHGIYNYPPEYGQPESHFVATLLETSGYLSGTIHEVMRFPEGGEAPANASLQGRNTDARVTFIKSYDGQGGQTHDVDYEGQLNSTFDEIEGKWTLFDEYGAFSGPFLMIRNRGNRVAAKVSVSEHV
jgi:hypothetical protein